MDSTAASNSNAVTSAPDAPVARVMDSTVASSSNAVTSAPGAPVARRGGRKACPAKRLRILEAAARLFAARDYHEVCVEHIAEAAGVAKGTVFRYFQSKENLFLAIVHHAVEMAVAGAQEAIAGESDVIARLRLVLTETIRFYFQHHGLFRVLHHDKSFRCSQEREDLLAKRRQLRNLLTRIIGEGIAQGRFRAVDPEFAATMLYGMVRSALFNYRETRQPEDLAGSMLELALTGIQADPRGGA